MLRHMRVANIKPSLFLMRLIILNLRVKLKQSAALKSCFRHMALRQIRSSKNFPMMPASVEVMVVTSDASIQDAVFGGGVDRMSANGFSLEMDDLADEADRDSSLQVSRKNTVADRLNPEVLAKLKAMRDR